MRVGWGGVGSPGVTREKHFYGLVFVFAGDQIGGWFDAVQTYSAKVYAMYLLLSGG